MKARIVFAIVALAGLSGCAAQFMKQAQSECAAFGYPAGSSEYASCVQQQYAAGQSNYQQRLMNASGIVNSGSSTPANGGTGFLKRSYISGMNRVCEYNQMGSAYVITVEATDICPMTAP